MQAEDSVTITAYKGFISNLTPIRIRLVKGFVSPSAAHCSFRRHVLFIATFWATCALCCNVTNVAFFTWAKSFFRSSIKTHRLPTSLIISSFILHYTHHVACHSAHCIASTQFFLLFQDLLNLVSSTVAEGRVSTRMSGEVDRGTVITKRDYCTAHDGWNPPFPVLVCRTGLCFFPLFCSFLFRPPWL